MVDLHTHSSCSDGSDRPKKVVDSAHRIGITTIALTDHDTTAGITEAALAATKHGIRFVSGVELALQHGDSHVHLLGLGFSHDNQDSQLERLLERIQKNRLERNLAMVERMRNQGLAIDYSEVQAESSGTSVGRPHMANLLVKKGLATNTQDAFRRLLGSGRRFHVPRQAIDLRDALDALTACGGYGVLAHPGGRTDNELTTHLHEMHAAGVTGVEAYHPSFSIKKSSLIRTLADKLGLFVTGGSDYHGGHSPNRKLGFWLPNEPIPEEAALPFISTPT